MISTEYLLCLLPETLCFVAIFKGCSILHTVNNDTVLGAYGLLSELITVQRELMLCLKVLLAELLAILLCSSECAKQQSVH